MDKNYWDERWKTNQTGWDVGEISTPLKSYIDQLDNKNISILIPGCGNAYEAEYLFKNGFTNTYIVEISDLAITSFLERCPDFPLENIYNLDFFELDDQFDLIIEQTFFCALSPSLRKNYVEKMYEILKPKGKIVGVLFNREFEHEGPPYGGNKDDYFNLFNDKFEIEIMDECYNSIKPRMGNELFIKLTRK